MAARWLATTTFLMLAAGAWAPAHAQNFDVGGQPLTFHGGTGTGTSVGSFRDYSNVITIGGSQIDARVTITGLSGASISTFDSTTAPYASNAFFQPNLNIASVGGRATFLVEFFENGQPATLQNFYVNTYDLDGSSSSASGRQYTDFTGFASYALASSTNVTTQTVGGATRFVTLVGGNLDYAPGTDDFNKIRARVFYTSASNVTISVGDTGATGLAYFALDFSVGYTFNNVAPDTTAPVVTASQSFSYTENQAANAVVATVAATDAIGVTGFRFSATGTQTSADGYYTIDNTGVVRITASGAAAGLANNDYDIAPNSFVYGVEAGDAAGNWSSAVNITLNVSAAPPTIAGPSGAPGAASSAISVNEAQTAVTTMTANRPVTWSITGGADAARFAINPSTGVLTFLAAPDYEAPVDSDANNAYVLVVTATGAGGASAQTVTVTVLDVAETPLAFTGANSTSGGNPAYAFSYAENSAAGTTLGTVSAAGGAGALTYAIVAGDPSGWYEIDATSGAIRLTTAGAASAANDFETGGGAHQLTVQVTDAASATASITVTLTETDIDETAPSITGPSGGAGAAASATTVNEGGTSVATLTANKPVTWSITGGPDAARFALDPATGALSFLGAPDYEAPTDADSDNAYVLVVTATDGLGNTATQTITVQVANLDESAPLITGPSGGAGAAASAVTVPEGGLAVTTLLADEGVVWSIAGGPDAARFAIDASTGAVTFVAASDYENPSDTDADNIYVVQIRAVDGAGNASVQTLTVTVVNVAEVAARVAEIAGALRGDLRSYAMKGLGDMLSYNEGLMRGDDTQCAAAPPQERLTRTVSASQARQDAALGWNDADCNRRYRVLWNAGVSVSHRDGDWAGRGLASLRVESDVSRAVTVGLGVLGSSARDELDGFSDSAISDRALQVNGYVRARLKDDLRAGVFAGVGRAWYDVDLNQNGLGIAGEMVGDRHVYGAMLSGDLAVSGVDLTTDIILSRAVEDLGAARLYATYGAESENIDFAVGAVDMTRISVPVTAGVRILEAERHDGRSADLLVSPGLLCEDAATASAPMVCGYQFGARLESDHVSRGALYLDYRFEAVGGTERNMLGLGYSDRFGARDQLMWSFDLNGGATPQGAADGRVSLQFKMVL